MQPPPAPTTAATFPAPFSPSGPTPPTPSRDTPDPGSPRRGLLWSVIAFTLIGIVMLFQQLGESAASAQKSPTSSTEVTAPDTMDPVRLSTSMMVRLKRAFSGFAATPTDRAAMDAQLRPMLKEIDNAAVTPVDKFRAAIAAGELVSAEEALQRIDALVDEPDGFATLPDDTEIARTIYAGDAASLTADEREAFIARHGYFAKLALSHNQPDTDPLRDEVTGKGGQLLASLIIFGCILLFAFFAGVTCFIIACVNLANRRWRIRFLPPLSGGSVFIEMVAMLAGGFLLMKLIGMGLSAVITDSQTLITIVLLMQWCLLAVCFYPLMRGVSFAELRRRIGWTRGEGVLTEIGAGLFAYFAFLPIYLVTAIVAFLLATLWTYITSGSAKPEAPSNPIADLIGGTSGFTLFLLFTLATIWAPLVEETVFRGALFRHLRSHLGLFAAGGISAVCFGVMHGYPFFLLLPVTMLGFNFALMREWRGSLIAPVTAHFLHNATILTFAITFFSAVG